MKVIIIGGGAAGMMAAYQAAKCGNDVSLYEKNEKLGNLNDGLSIGVIENGRKFNKRITLIFTLEDTGL